jgi:hypothetical protein
MPPIDYREARSRVRLAEVLDLIGFAASWRRGAQVRGPCPVHRSRTPTSRSFAADHGKQLWHCFRCGAGGNGLDLCNSDCMRPSSISTPSWGVTCRGCAGHPRGEPCPSHDEATPTVPGSCWPN